MPPKAKKGKKNPKNSLNEKGKLNLQELLLKRQDKESLKFNGLKNYVQRKNMTY
jgi:hypothetical protein